MKQIQKINILHLTNAAHILFVRTAVGRAEACDALKTKATEELKALKKALEKEDELFVQSQKDLTTGPRTYCMGQKESPMGPCTAAWTKKNLRWGHAPAAWAKKNLRRGRAPLHGPKRISDGAAHRCTDQKEFPTGPNY
ncbi:hypothetical protein [Hoylesella enoeca]|uniref:hypothetical protein n=1 Tax=Hoylesella enoeca TaxID=76123 RepID=UPI0011DCB48C|nr:hypothetical protein [Hoylesella enoeca]